jgi:hypothetical protein
MGDIVGLGYGGVQSGLDLGSALGGLFGGSPGSNQPAFAKVGAVTGIGFAVASIVTPIPIAGQILGPVIALLSKIFKGADPFQVPASRIEQAFEAGSDNLLLIAQSNGMISREEAAQGMQIFLQKGIEYYDQMVARDPRIQRAAEKGKRNMSQVIQDEIRGVLAKPVLKMQPIDLGEARKLYLRAGLPGWYPESLQAGANLADEFLNAIEQTRPALPRPKGSGGPADGPAGVPSGKKALAGAAGLGALILLTARFL